MLLRLEQLVSRKRISWPAARCTHEQIHCKLNEQKYVQRRSQHSSNVNSATTHSQVITTKRKQTAATGEPGGGEQPDRLGSKISVATGGEAPDRQQTTAQSVSTTNSERESNFKLPEWFNESNVLLNSEYPKYTSYGSDHAMVEHETIEMLTAMTMLGLQSIPKERENLHSKKSNLIWQANEYGSQYDLDLLVYQVARATGTNLITLDRQDAEELLSSHVEIAEVDTSEEEDINEDVEAFDPNRDEDADDMDVSQPVSSPFTSMKMYLSNAAHHKGPLVEAHVMDDFCDEIVNFSGKECNDYDAKTILHIRSVYNLTATTSGSILLGKIMRAVSVGKTHGKKITVILTADISGADEVERIRSSMDDYYSVVNIDFRKIGGDRDGHEVMRNKEINTRRITGIANNRMGQNIEFGFPRYSHYKDASLSVLDLPDIGKNIWTNDQLHYLTAITLGSTIQASSAEAIPTVFEDNFKAAYKRCSAVFVSDQDTDTSSPKVDLDPKHYNRYERKLLSGVVNPDSIHVGFDSVCAPDRTINALKSIISLPIKYPTAFSHGILSTATTSGVLLFGPPGSGKTLLAKAIAKDCGAPVLEIKGSEVFDMYVGESEKNVKAIFSLARKLQPCVVFLDEVDAVFGSRRSDHSNPSHREIINQFMSEWDGIASENRGVVIMGATNRPFDLDEAILRRLPRRILVDLPSKSDRLAILRIHLKTETLDKSVDLEDIAKRTPFYSGSDLKNICVAAALGAVEEQTQKGVSGKESFKTRTLNARHFDASMKNISASISEDMVTLHELRKFDQRYGDGYRHKYRPYGFGDTDGIQQTKVR